MNMFLYIYMTSFLSSLLKMGYDFKIIYCLDICVLILTFNNFYMFGQHGNLLLAVSFAIIFSSMWLNFIISWHGLLKIKIF